MTSNFSFLAFIFAVLALGFYYISRTKKKTAGFGASSAPTPFLNLYAKDFTQAALAGRLDPVVGRETEVQKLTQVLSRRGKNNAILVGDPGVGKTAIVEGLAAQIVKNQVPETLQHKRLIALDVASLLAGTKYRGEFEDRAKKIVQEISATNRSIILFVDEVHSLVQSQGSEGSMNFSDILKPALARGDLQMIGATSREEYEKYIKADAALERRFQPIEVREPSPQETLVILQAIKDRYREYHKVEFTDAALETAVKLSNKLLPDRKLPDKAIDAMDEAGAMVRVAYLHPALSAVLYQAAVTKYPDVANLWKNIQALDKKISAGNGATKKSLTKQREAAEEDLRSRGMLTVDSSDIESVIQDWVGG